MDRYRRMAGNEYLSFSNSTWVPFLMIIDCGASFPWRSTKWTEKLQSHVTMSLVSFFEHWIRFQYFLDQTSTGAIDITAVPNDANSNSSPFNCCLKISYLPSVTGSSQNAKRQTATSPLVITWRSTAAIRPTVTSWRPLISTSNSALSRWTVRAHRWWRLLWRTAGFVRWPANGSSVLRPCETPCPWCTPAACMTTQASSLSRSVRWRCCSLVDNVACNPLSG